MIDGLIDQLPAVEQDVMRLVLQYKKNQSQIARILGVSQPTINYRIKRAKERLQFLNLVPETTSEEVEHVLRTLGAKDQIIETMVLYLTYKSQSEVARQTSKSQGAVRHWLIQAIDILKKDRNPDEIHKRVRTACQLLVSKPNMINDGENTTRKNGDVHLHLDVAPRVRGELRPGATVEVLDGLCSGMTVECQEQSLVLRLCSRNVFLTWAGSPPRKDHLQSTL